MYNIVYLVQTFSKTMFPSTSTEYIICTKFKYLLNLMEKTLIETQFPKTFVLNEIKVIQFNIGDILCQALENNYINLNATTAMNIFTLV